jgi:hypothetical protein
LGGLQSSPASVAYSAPGLKIFWGVIVTVLTAVICSL